MSAIKYNAGDKVRILSKKHLMENECLTCMGVADEMFDYCGKDARITYKADGHEGWYYLDVDNGEWAWEDEMFESCNISIEKSELSKLLEI